MGAPLEGQGMILACYNGRYWGENR